MFQPRILSPRAKAGVALSRFVLWIVVGAMAALIATLLVLGARIETEVNHIYAATTAPTGELADKLLAQRERLFAFWLQAAQLILLNLLLPLLTALFGYIFGSHQADRRD